MPQAPRRNADGSLDIGHHRRKARLLRGMARRRLGHALARVLAKAIGGIRPMGLFHRLSHPLRASPGAPTHLPPA